MKFQVGDDGRLASEVGVKFSRVGGGGPRSKDFYFNPPTPEFGAFQFKRKMKVILLIHLPRHTRTDRNVRGIIL